MPICPERLRIKQHESSFVSNCWERYSELLSYSNLNLSFKREYKASEEETYFFTFTRVDFITYKLCKMTEERKKVK